MIYKVSGLSQAASTNHEESRLDLAEADMVVFLGDFNYRLFGISYDEARDFVSQRSFDWLREKDQLRAEMQAGKVFQGMREAVIAFPPTYKFARHQPGLAGKTQEKMVQVLESLWLRRFTVLEMSSGLFENLKQIT